MASLSLLFLGPKTSPPIRIPTLRVAPSSSFFFKPVKKKYCSTTPRNDASGGSPLSGKEKEKDHLSFKNDHEASDKLGTSGEVSPKPDKGDSSKPDMGSSQRQGKMGRNLYATLKSINPEFKPPPLDEENSTPFFYNGIEKYYHFLIKALTGILQSNIAIGPKLLLLLCFVSPFKRRLFFWGVLHILGLRIIFLTLHGFGLVQELKNLWVVVLNLTLKWFIKKGLGKHFWPTPPKPKEKAKVVKTTFEDAEEKVAEEKVSEEIKEDKG